MKKKIGVFATGWGSEILYQYVNGAFKRLQQDGVDLYCYLSYALLNDEDATKQAELNIFELGKKEKLDGALLFGNGLDFPGVFEDLAGHFAGQGIPVTCCGKKSELTYFVGSDNYSGTKDMCNHLIEKHGAKDIMFFAGSRENEDSNTRKNAIGDAMKEHGMELTEEKILYTNWNTGPAEQYIKDLVNEGKKLPDTICCANDSIAMVTCMVLAELGIDVPKQVKVTGFDHEYISRLFSPAVSSVDQNFEKIGYESAEVVLKLLNGEECARETFVPCEFIPGESCGCSVSADLEKERKNLGAAKYMSQINETNFDRKILRIERNLMTSHEVEDLARCFENLYSLNDSYEGETFFIMLEPSYYKTMANRELKHKKTGYSSQVDLAYGICDGKVLKAGSYDFSDIIECATSEKSRFFLFTPLHENDNNYGVLVFCDDTKKIFEQSKLFRYVERLGMVLGKFHGNVSIDILNRRLLEMTETDALTRVKNRTAYEAATERINTRMSIPGIEFGVAIFDVNNLKKINDKLGHEAGDEYIINCCMMVCNHFKKSKVYRIGGDEFAVILENDDYRNREAIIDHMKQEMQVLAESVDIKETERVSTACGLSVYRPDTDKSIIDVFNRADARMYLNKAEMKMQRE